MKPEIVLFSRTRAKDYHYLFPLPPDSTEAVRGFVQQQLQAMQQGTSDGVLHFFLSDTDAVLLRAVDSGSCDAFGRPIASLEGIYCPAADIRPFWLCLPPILPGFFSSPSLYGVFVKNDAPVHIPISRVLDDFAALSAKDSRKEVLKQTIWAADMPVSFTYDANGLHPSQPLSAQGRKQWLPQERRRYTLHLHISRRQKTASVEAVSAGNSSPFPLLHSAEIARAEKGWKLSELNAAAAAVRQTLEADGWQHGKAASGEGGNL